MVDPHSSIDDTPTVVIEPEKPLQKRLKQYVVVRAFDDGSLHCKTGALVKLTEASAVPYVSSRLLVPLDVAIREKLYPLKHEGIIEKAVEAVTGAELPDTPVEPAPAKKSFLGNTLRDAIRGKKADTVPESKSKIDLAKLAAIKSGGNK